MHGKRQLFIDRMSKIGVDIELQGEFPWVYVVSINREAITKDEFNTRDGFKLGYNLIRGDYDIYFTELDMLFFIIRSRKDKIWEH